MKTYWRSLEELSNPKEFRIAEAKEEAKQKSLLLKNDEKISASSRRDFLKTLGFSLGAATIAASCKRPIDKAIPYLVKPEEVTPGKANYYASTYYDDGDYCSVLVKVRDGRPIKIEGNSLSPISQQGTTARVQASVLNLYDEARYKAPSKQGKQISWEDADKEILQKLKDIQNKKGKTVLLTPTIISPSTSAIIQNFIEKNNQAQWVQYDAISVSGMLSANEKSFGISAIPDYKLEKAKVLVSFGADFLGTWLSPVEYTKKYAVARDLKDGQKEMLRHYQFESGLSLSGSNADVRFPIKPSEEGGIVLALYNEIAKAKGADIISGPKTSVDIKALAEELLSNARNSIVLSGSNDVNIQLIINGINQLLGNYGSTISWDSPLLTRQGKDTEMNQLIAELENGEISALLVWGANPLYDHPKAKSIGKTLEKLPLSVSFSERKDETSNACQYILPEPNYLENWGDFEPKTGQFSLAQPTIHPLFDSRPAQETLLKWLGKDLKYKDYLQEFWTANMFPKQNRFTDTEMFWKDSLQKGVFSVSNKNIPEYSKVGLMDAGQQLTSDQKGIEVVLYESIALGSGKYGNNPWLQELPDPMAKISWDNFAAIPVSYAEENGLKNEDVISINGTQLPVFVQPGQAKETISVALGYGRKLAGKVGENIGTNLFDWIQQKDGQRITHFSDAVVSKVEGKTYDLAISQTHHSMEGRPIARETTLDKYVEDPSSGNEIRKEHLKHAVTLYEEMDFPGHHWGMAVDLNACTGCGNCAISCQAENNIAVIGKEQVRNRRIMHWIRIDRYYSENPDNPDVSFQPVMCQHCDNAPCENVCPVAATPHSNEGLNQMAYNRCVGTKYCVNNCPYRVRRFNWFQYRNNEKFDYNQNNELSRLVLNPDVTVRSRGVVEKCSMCVQRIQEKKQDAKISGRKITDGEIQPACAQSCPANAIVFGDMNDPNSRISKLMKDKRNYHLLEELHTLPSVGYLTKVRNKQA